MRDCRDGRLLMRFRASRASDLQVCSGILGVARLGFMDSDSLASATRDLIKDFCTIGKHAPRSATRVSKGRFDEALYNQIRSKVQILVTDAAASEILASKILRGTREGANRDPEPLLPNVRLIGRDAAHAATRLLKRPWSVIPCVRDVVVSTITSQDSVAQRIFHSNIFSDMLQKEIQKDAHLPQVASLSAAKHRFASFSKPLGRIVLHIQALFRVVHSIMFLRDAGWCKSWLNSMNGEKLLLLALAADAADSLLEFVRALDSETFDPAGLNMQVQDFLSNIHVLFGAPAQAFEVSGYAKHCWLSLRDNPVFVMQEGRQKRIEVTDACRQAALQAMRPWVRHVFDACKAEFPDYDIFASMEVLNVAIQDEEHIARISHEQSSSCIASLCKILQVCPHTAAAELHTLFPVARGLQRRHHCGSRAAWALALKRTQHRPETRARYPVVALSKLLLAHACWTCSTSAVEQNFSKAERCSGSKRFGPKAASAEARSLIVLAFKADGSGTEEDLVHLATRLFSYCKKSDRCKNKTSRLDKGLRRHRGGKTEQAFIRQRRDAVRAVARPFRRCLSEHLPGINAEPVSEQGQQELDFQAKAARQRKVEAYRDGYLSDDGSGLADAANKTAKSEIVLDRQRACKRARIQSDLSAMQCKVQWSWARLRHDKIWLGPGVTIPNNLPRLQLTEEKIVNHVGSYIAFSFVSQ
ncbi:unnamed protein product [Symbiodinium necroappetens]|uniref:Uncharacterized protein n=1 Tax=Symbiodinium necroappetens TaxID=1628268 RepID=A0A812W463_9DINO|nr:unnamed protein product [Symbiodinium necroappetens]